MICLLLSHKHFSPQNCIIIWNSVLTLGSFWIQNFLVDFCFFLHLWHIYNSVSSSSSKSVKLRRQSKTKLIWAAYQQDAFYRGRTPQKTRWTLKLDNPGSKLSVIHSVTLEKSAFLSCKTEPRKQQQTKPTLKHCRGENNVCQVPGIMSADIWERSVDDRLWYCCLWCY